MGTKEIKLPDLGEGVTEGEIIDIKVSVGDSISMDQVLLEVMTDKASMEIPSSIEGQIKEIKVQKGDIAPVGQVLLILEVQNESNENPTQSVPNSVPNSVPKNSPPKTRTTTLDSFESQKNYELATPATRKLAQELEIPLKDVPTTNNKVTREDLINYVKSSAKAKPLMRNKHPSPLTSLNKEDKRTPLRGVKRIMFETMTLSKSTIPHFTIVETANMKHLVKVRTQLKEKLKIQNIRLTYLPFFIKAVISSIKEFPIFNSSYDETTKELIYKSHLSIGFAVDTPQGLLVPVLKNTEQKSFLEIVKDLQSLGTKAREGTIQAEDLKGGSITLTNLGSIAGVSGTPIINPPEVAILGIYRLYQKVIQVKDHFEENPFINFSITCDHRFIDGATAARFLKNFIEQIEEPSLLILN